MKAVSLFSGVGGFELGFQRAGIETVLQVEQDPWCLSVLERHWPDCERLNDVRRVGSRDGADLVYGGFPCQDVSVAGKRGGLSAERSGLWFEFHRIVSELRPRWVCIENVPGLLSSGPEPGADLGVVLRGLVELGYGVAWRVLDARWFGVPQRRRRVFIVGCLGDARRAAAVLAVCESCGGHSAAGGEAGQDLAYALNASVRGTGDGHGNAWNSNYVADADDIAPTLDDGAQRASVELPMIAVDVQNCIARPDIGTLDATSRKKLGADWLVAGPDRAADNLIAFQPNSSRTDEEWRENESPPIKKGSGGDGAVPPAISGSMGVRRLTPLECSRLQGWPDEWTRFTADGKVIPDSHQYRMIGNGVVAPVAEFIGHRLMAVDQA
jgi:DNA (cytosine-5)-methyltransferase 1